MRRSSTAARTRPGSPPAEEDWETAPDPSELVAETGARIVVQAVPSAPSVTADAFAQVIGALAAGADVVIHLLSARRR